MIDITRDNVEQTAKILEEMNNPDKVFTSLISGPINEAKRAYQQLKALKILTTSSDYIIEKELIKSCLILAADVIDKNYAIGFFEEAFGFDSVMTEDLLEMSPVDIGNYIDDAMDAH